LDGSDLGRVVCGKGVEVKLGLHFCS
jgi:hypothetical protein